MKSRHAAALALVGWYLLSPPFINDKTHRSLFAVKAPLSQWYMLEVFDTAKECEKALESTRKRASEDEKNPNEDATWNQFPDAKSFFQATLEAFSNSVCVASDDPHLASSTPRP